MYTLAVCVLVLVALWFLRGQRSAIRRYGKRLPRPPGTLPFAGNGIWFLQSRQKLLDWFVQCERITGFETFEISVPSLPPGIVINDPRNVEHVLKNHDIFVKGSFFRTRSWDLFGNGIINADGELWKIQRKAGLRFFSNANLKNLIEEILPPILADTEKYLNHAAKMDNSVNLQSVMLELTTRVMGNMAYDMDMPASLPFSKSFDLASGKIAERFQNPFWAITELLLGGPLKRAVNEVKTFSSMIVSDAVDKRDKASRLAKENTYPLKNNLINALLDHIEDHEIVADAAMNYLSAGRDTTAQTLTWTLYLLMRHPEIRKRLETEIQALLALNSDHTPLSLEALQASSSSYAAAVFNESLRLYPPVPIEIKECTVPTTFPDGTSLPKGAIVMWTTWALGRSKNIWGGDADDFRPERWLMPGIEGEAQTLRSVTAFEWPVFNGGPRSCLGKRMAELLALSVITDLVSKFDFEEIIEGVLEPGHKPRERLSQNSLTLPMEGGLPCHIRQTREKSSSAGLI